MIALKIWDKLWFSPVDARSLAWLRITLGVLLIITHVTSWPELVLLFHDAGLVDPILLEAYWTPLRFSPFDGLSPAGLQLMNTATLAVFIAFTLGFQTRIMSVLSVILLAGIWHRSPWIQNGGDRLLRLWVIYLALVPAGAAWSIDAWIRQKRGLPVVTQVPVLAHRLIQLQVVVMYTATGIIKLDGSAWQDGSAIYYALSDGSYSRFTTLMDTLLQYSVAQWATMGLTWATLVFEVAFLPLIAWRRTRVATLLVGIGLHAGIWMTMSVGIFSWASVWAYPVFVDPKLAGQVVDAVRARFAPPARLDPKT